MQKVFVMDEFSQSVHIQEKLLAVGIGRRQINDPFFRDGNVACGRAGEPKQAVEYNLECPSLDEVCWRTVVMRCQESGCGLRFDSIREYEEHYNVRHRWVCLECKKPLPSSHLLEIHALEKHDSLFSLLAERKPMYQCFIPECHEKFWDANKRHDHAIKDHKFPPNFRFDDAWKDKAKKKQEEKRWRRKMEVEGSEDMMEVAELSSKVEKKAHNLIPRSVMFGLKSKPGLEVLFRRLDPEDPEATEIESLCVNCGENGITKLLLTKIPYYKDVIVSSFSCLHCGNINNDLQSASPIEEKGVRIKLRVESMRDLNRQVMKSDYASVTIPELDFEIPRKSQKGEISTVEGVLQRTITGLQQEQPLRKSLDAENAQKIEEFIQKIQGLLELKQSFTLIVDDPSGSSFVENPLAPRTDPQLKVSWYVRSEEDNKFVGIYPSEDDTCNRDGENETSNASISKEQMEGASNESDVPHFKQVVIMATNCNACGHRTNEVKSGSGISEKGVRFTLNMTNPAVDLNRDVLKAETCSVLVPELELDAGPMTLGGHFTTVEGILTCIKDGLSDWNPLIVGDSSQDQSKRQLEEFVAKIDDVIAGRMSAHIVLDDPAGNSYVQSIKDVNEEDSSLEVVHYERSYEQNEELGLIDMKDCTGMSLNLSSTWIYWSIEDFRSYPLTIWTGDEAKDDILPFDVYTAASIGALQAVKDCITKDPNLAERPNRSGWTPLMYACYYCHHDIIEYLVVTAGVDVNQGNSRCETPLILATKCGHVKAVSFLLQNGGLMEMRDEEDWTALFHAVFSSYLSLVELLLKQGANPNVMVRKNFLTPLMLAAEAGQGLICQLLLQHGAKAGTVNARGQTARSLAIMNEHHHIVTILDEMAEEQSEIMTESQSLRESQSHTEAAAAMARAQRESICDLEKLLKALDLLSYLPLFVEEDIDLQIFLTLSDQDFRSLGITKLGPRRKMTSAIARWHAHAPLAAGLERTYADHLEAEIRSLEDRLRHAEKAVEKLASRLEKEERDRKRAEERLATCEGGVQDAARELQFITQNIISEGDSSRAMALVRIHDALCGSLPVHRQHGEVNP
ncbi:unnamed protein product [Darwinula stevensoni]|uniref:SAM domain-containing protein n=1 Tax=Darwinula stevensoni TaxID=69355 RepID=A0A7R9ABI6_9CRUS|nr:unnamed protein product [Darwinula stevensoni]CAG0899414.1 unnamed protein product [Darwinula stevensoni]